MIELTTGIAFLISSLYATGNAKANNVEALGILPDSSKQIILTEARFLDPKALEAHVRETFSADPILVDIARCESTFRQYDTTGNVIRGRVDKGDIGLMQINERYHAEDANKLGYNIYTVEGNMAYAKYLYEHEGTDPWLSSAPCWSTKSLARSN